MASWWESLFFPGRTCVARRRLRSFGHILSSYLKGIRPNQKLKTECPHTETETKSLQSLEEVERIIGYNFKNRGLLHQAFTHPSYNKNCVSYERLEYVGDSVLNFLITKEQFCMYPDLPPGSLTTLRAANVDTENLARVAVRHNFHRYIRLKTPVLGKQIQAFIKVLPKHPIHSHGLINAPKVLADVVESTIGAVFIDSNYSLDKTWEVAMDLLDPIITPETLEKNPVRKLFEICQKHKLEVKLVDLWAQEGIFKVFVNHQLSGKGMCHEKKEIALNRAANDAYKEVVRRKYDETEQRNATD